MWVFTKSKNLWGFTLNNSNKSSLIIEFIVRGSQALLLVIYFWIYAKKGLPSQEMLMFLQAICIITFFEYMNRFKLKYDSL